MQVVGCVLSFRENYELVALVINLAVKQFSLQSIQKLVQLRVTFNVVPFFAKRAQLVVVFLQSIDETRFEVGWLDVPGWRLLTKDACVIMAGECADAAPASSIGDHSYFAYVETDEIDSLYAAFCARGIDVIKPLRNEPWGMREFGLRTVDGHRIMFGQEL